MWILVPNSSQKCHTLRQHHSDAVGHLDLDVSRRSLKVRHAVILILILPLLADVIVRGLVVFGYQHCYCSSGGGGGREDGGGCLLLWVWHH